MSGRQRSQSITIPPAPRSSAPKKPSGSSLGGGKKRTKPYEKKKNGENKTNSKENGTKS